MLRKKDTKITWKPGRPYLCQVHSEGLEYSFASKDYHQINPFVYCKDFLQDAIAGFLNNKRIQIYSFIYDPSHDIPLYLDQTRILITNAQDNSLGSKIENCLDFINQIETRMKMKKTTVIECADPPELYKNCGVWLFEGSKRWMKAPPMISLYTLIIRVGFSHKKGTPFEETFQNIIEGKTKLYQKNDKGFIESSQKAFEWFFSYGDRKLFYPKIASNYPSDASIQDMHNSYGIVCYSTKHYAIKSKFPHWYRLQGSN